MTPHTVVRISKEFNKSERDLELDGEALFTVGSDGGKPFIVHTKNLHIQVQASGSRFKVEAFAKNAGEEADLLSGKLKVKKSYHSDTDNEPETLETGEMVMINRDIDLMEKEKLDSTELKALQERFQGTGLPSAGLAPTGLPSTGLPSTGLPSNGLSSTGLTPDTTGSGTGSRAGVTDSGRGTK